MKIAAALIAAALTAAASPALAQQICTPDSTHRFLICQPNPATQGVAPPALSPGAGYVSPNGNGAGVVGLLRDLSQAGLGAKARKQLKNGQCAEAEATAIKANDLPLAQYVHDNCAQAVAPPKAFTPVTLAQLNSTAPPPGVVVNDDGTWRGYDPAGHMWHFDPKTRAYFNLGTMRGCVFDEFMSICK